MDKFDEMARKREAILAGGGEDSIQMQHNLGKMTARERIAFLLDEDSFIETGSMTKGNGAGVITGCGTLNGRLVYILSEDYTVEGGLITSRNSRKIVNVMEAALKMGAPLIQIFDSAGAKISEGMEVLSSYGKIINMNAKLSGVVPQIAVIAGPCTGLSALSAAMSDITIITENNGEIYVNSPKFIEESSGKFAESSMYANSGRSTQNGSVQITAGDDSDALGIVRKLLGYLPSNNIELAPLGIDNAGAIRVDTNLNEMSVSESKDIRLMISSIIDEGSCLEFDRNLSESVITMLSKINGLTIGIVATDKNSNGGKLGIKACEKITKFVKLCDSFNISLVSMVDTKGFEASMEEENNGLALTAAKMIYALAEAVVPKVAIVIGEAYGAAYVSLASREAAFDVTYAWPNAVMAVAEPGALVKILDRQEIVSSENPRLTEQELKDRYIEEQASAFKAAEDGYIDDVIKPSETAVRLFVTLDALQSKRIIKYPKKHGSTLI